MIFVYLLIIYYTFNNLDRFFKIIDIYFRVGAGRKIFINIWATIIKGMSKS
jgi:hypothetical protein